MSAPNSENMKTFHVLFWYNDYQSMMSDSGIEIALGFYYDLKEYFNEFLVLQKTRSTLLTSDQMNELVTASHIVKSDMLYAVIMEIKIDRAQLASEIKAL